MTRLSLPRAHRRVARVAVAASGALVIASLTGCSLLSSFLPPAQPNRDASTGEIVEGNEHADVFSIRVGDCVNDESSADEINTIPVVPCAEPHDNEVYHAFNLAGSTYPGEDSVQEQSYQGCYDAFEAFVGFPFETSEIDYWPLYPTSGSWSQGDREVLCLAYDMNQQVSGSLRGAGR